MKKLINKILWAIKRKQFEQDLMKYCKLEYSKGEASYAFNRALARHKSAFINEGDL